LKVRKDGLALQALLVLLLLVLLAVAASSMFLLPFDNTKRVSDDTGTIMLLCFLARFLVDFIILLARFFAVFVILFISCFAF